MPGWLVNDGKNVNGLTKIENKLNDANATISLKGLLPEAGHKGTLRWLSPRHHLPCSTRGVVPDKVIPANIDYTVSAHQPAIEEGMAVSSACLIRRPASGSCFNSTATMHLRPQSRS